MNSKRIKIAIIVCIILVFLFTMLVSYAYWNVTRTQTGTNKISGACLSIKLEESFDNSDNGIKLEDAWPCTDNDGLNQEGYHFKVINKCDEAVTYQIVLDSLEIDNPMNLDYVKVAIDNGEIKRYSDLIDTTDKDIEYNPVDSKVLLNGQIPGSINNTVGEVEHTIKLWISEDSPNAEIGKKFNSKVRVIAGQQLPKPEYVLTSGSCFDFDKSTGTITGYHEQECTTDYLVVPQKIDGVMVKIIDFYGDSSSLSMCPDCKINWDYVDLTKATGLETIEQKSFNRYEGIEKELIIPDNVHTVGIDAFQFYKGVKLTLGRNIRIIDAGAFVNYIGTGQKLIIPDKVEIIGMHAFDNYEGIGQELIIPDSVQIIGTNAFYDFQGESVTIGSGVKEIGAFVFPYYNGPFNINMSEDQFNSIPKGVDWTHSVVFNYLK